MKVAYGVVWHELGSDWSGRLVIGPHSLRLVSLADARRTLSELPFDELDALQVRVPDEHAASAVIVLETRSGGRVEIESVVDRWLLVDLFEKAFEHGLSGERPSRRLLVAVRLKPGCREKARELLRSGPPFEPGGTHLAAHDVFLLEDEVLFSFETDLHDVEETESAQLWDAAMAWREVMTSVQVGEHVYSWVRPGEKAHLEAVGVGF